MYIYSTYIILTEIIIFFNCFGVRATQLTKFSTVCIVVAIISP
jgi:hypothetical protein